MLDYITLVELRLCGLQDLLKHTPKDHGDRLALQLALSELENLTFKLNEMKRESENVRDVKHMASCLTGRYSLKPDALRYLLRQDEVLQLVGDILCIIS